MHAPGAFMLENSCRFIVWAPDKEQMYLHLITPFDRKYPMIKNDEGYFSIEISALKAGARYFFSPENEKDYPDPASFYQPEGVHGPSEVVDHLSFQWEDHSWHGLPQENLIFYEIHVGTFTPEGTFEAIIPRLDEIATSGINALELMPVAQFPGTRNWGYDGVYPFAVQNSYGGPYGLKKLVDACHERKIAVFLDTVFNHLGIEGNYFEKFGPYFTKKYCIPWGDSINFDGEWSDGVRDYFSDNTVYWLKNYHIDGLRLDAIHMIYDFGAVSFWELVQEKIKGAEVQTGRRFYLIAESDLNSPKVVRPPEVGGFGLDAQWLDDFHHALYVALDKSGRERYEDFGRMEQLAKAYTDGFVHSGQYVSFRKRKFGSSSAAVPGNKFVVFNSNHDQIGNRVKGERLSMLVDFEKQKLAAAALLLSPYLPLFFMGEEYGENTPFFYFINHSDEKLMEAVREGRKKEFANYKWGSEPPDPGAIETFNSSKINWDKRRSGQHKIMLEWNKKLIELRRENKALQTFNKDDIRILMTTQEGFMMHRCSEDEKTHLIAFFNFSEANLNFTLPNYTSEWPLVLSSNDRQWIPALHVKHKPEDSKVIYKPNEEITLPPCSVIIFTNKIGVNSNS
jgi:maltooligosyltrehalose trehalohydrolase